MSDTVVLGMEHSQVRQMEKHSADADACSYAPPPSLKGSTTTESVMILQSRIPNIWKAFLQRMQLIDQLEKRIDEHVSRKRRRIQNMLDQMQPSYRRSTVRMFVTHQFDRYSGMWTLVIEGKLLIGNLDHVSAAKVDKEGVMSVRQHDSEKTIKSHSHVNAASTTSPNMASTTLDRNQYRIGGEEEEPVEPILFTHLFDKLEVTFRTIYQPRSASTSSFSEPVGISANKKSRSAKRKAVQQDATMEVDTEDLRASAPTKLVWNKHPTTSSSTVSTPDSHAFWAQYNNHFSERPPPPGMKFHSVVAEIELYPTRPQLQQNDQDDNAEPLYQIVNDLFRDKIFAGKYGISTKSSNGDTDDAGPESTPPVPAPPEAPSGTGSYDYSIPLENDIRIPLYLSYNEIIMALFQYIHDHNLHDPADKSLIICDQLLREIFAVESMNFGHVKQLLLGKGLIKLVPGGPAASQQQNLLYNAQPEPQSVVPVSLTYVMSEKTTSPQIPAGFEEEESYQNVASTSTGRALKTGPIPNVMDDPSHSPSVLSFDMDVTIPALFNYRARELLRNVKKREFEYTTCRTKARYTLVASKGNEDIVKSKIEQAISGQGFMRENVPVFLALARAAHPYSEARSASQLDARSCDLVGRVHEANRKAMASWQAVAALQTLLGEDSQNANKESEDGKKSTDL